MRGSAIPENCFRNSTTGGKPSLSAGDGFDRTPVTYYSYLRQSSFKQMGHPSWALCPCPSGTLRSHSQKAH
jgi:hypothetical protein